MITAARISAVIELLEAVELSFTSGGQSADALVGDYFRARRYAGSKDRRAVSEQLYRILRSREVLQWCLDESGTDLSARALVLADMALHQEDTSVFGQDAPHAPAALSEDEQALLATVMALDPAAAPAAARANIPPRHLEGFKARFQTDWQQAAIALNSRAPLNVRVNALKYDASKQAQLIENKNITVSKCTYAPDGLQLEGRINLAGEKAYRDGLIEVQDEASQIASLLVDAAPGMQVLDLCAGAGGKSFAVASSMAGKGQIHAFDTHGGRLQELGKRMQRAGARNIQHRKLPLDAAGSAAILDPHMAAMDRVIVDAPCSGSGTWRRSPDLRWRHDSAALDALARLQNSLIREGAGLVKPGGRLIYMTCSVFEMENEAVVEAFLADNPDWKPLNWQDVWTKSLPDVDAPTTLASRPDMLQLAPHKHQTDGFFVALLQRLN